MKILSKWFPHKMTCEGNPHIHVNYTTASSVMQTQIKDCNLQLVCHLNKAGTSLYRLECAVKLS